MDVFQKAGEVVAATEKEVAKGIAFVSHLYDEVGSKLAIFAKDEPQLASAVTDLVEKGEVFLATSVPAITDKGLDLPQVAALTSANGARRFGIDRHGAIEPGTYADLAIVDLHASQVIREESLFQRHRISPYLGMKLRGVVRKTLRRGEVIYSDGAITASTPGSLITPQRNRNATSGTHAQQLPA